MTEESKTKKRRRPSAEVMEAAVAAQDKMREEQLKNAPAKKKGQGDSDKVSYDQWWMMIQKKVKLRPYLKEIVWADFKARGAGKMELEEKYDELLKVFGYKW